MTKEEIILMAREVGLASTLQPNDARLMRFAQLVRNDYSNKHAQLWLKRIDEAVKAEREACAKVCDGYANIKTWSDFSAGTASGAKECAAEIRARGQK